MQRLLWWPSGQVSALQCRGPGFNSWSGNQDPTCHGGNSPHSPQLQKPTCCSERSLHTTVRTQHGQKSKQINVKHKLKTPVRIKTHASKCSFYFHTGEPKTWTSLKLKSHCWLAHGKLSKLPRRKHYPSKNRSELVNPRPSSNSNHGFSFIFCQESYLSTRYFSIEESRSHLDFFKCSSIASQPFG